MSNILRFIYSIFMRQFWTLNHWIISLLFDIVLFRIICTYYFLQRWRCSILSSICPPNPFQTTIFIFILMGTKKLSLARFELTICMGALFVVTKWYMIIEYKHHNQSWKHKFLNSQTVQTIHHSQQGPGRGVRIGYLYFYAVRLAFQILK